MCAATFFCFYHFWVIFSICDATFFFTSFQLTDVQSPSAWWSNVEACHLCGSHLLGGQFWSAPVENPREMSSDCQNLGDAAAFALLRLLHQVFAKNNCRGSSEAPSRQGSNQGLILCHLFTVLHCRHLFAQLLTEIIADSLCCSCPSY